MSEEILVNITPQEVRIALLSDGILQEVHIERSVQHGLIGNIYKGRINRVLPGIQSAFVDIGLERSAFLHVDDIAAVDTDISKLLKGGQELWVQVYKDPLGNKGARLTTLLTIPSRYLVFTPGIQQVAISQKIVDEQERERLLGMITAEPAGGYIFRTAAEGATQQAIDEDKIFLQRLWLKLVARGSQAKAGEIIYAEIPLILRILRDFVAYEGRKIWVDDQATVLAMQSFAQGQSLKLKDNIEYYNNDAPIFDLYSVENELQKALQRKVYLKSGGHLIFDQTEAMTTIDVNTGSYIGNGNLEQTIFKTNLEAVEVIARQIRLRNLGGIIIIDFIDMSHDANKESIMQSLGSAMAKDSARVQISELSSLGLVQLTRKRARESLEHILCVACPLCRQRGSIKSVETVCYEIFRDLKRMAPIYPWSGFLLVVGESIINTLEIKMPTILAKLEVQLGKPIKIKKELSFTQEQYNILPLADRE